MSHLINLTRLRTVASALSELNEKVVFVGGAVVSLYSPNAASEEPRPTNDIDLIIEVTTYTEFSGQIEERLRQLGFVNDIESGIICRYRIQGIIVDIMPTDENVLGFSNRWYGEGLLTAINYPISEQQSIRILSAPYFIATKLEAFNSFRHGQDPRKNSDFEDLIYVFDNRESLLGEIYTCPESVRSYLQTELKRLLKDPSVYENINSHLERTTASQRTKRMLTIWNEIVAL
ncbi:MULTISPECIES: nucleotidyl transferase AbiEii/AbiGii toxin family protein [unclassified Spirosoma]|uniref:nucleotidyl transferase AbiEii/AbiGii toxin family protein n=1 Tax=unclassified Spirosoma TaxID=2621999 RepID=UPI00096173FB|nr:MULTISPECIES: nucleotidyl transferase AbiEii/AbiGii toxin family protein [unclassified Spirosoma]MBN8823641.1 nucleotidyl transferase AbiEii/AbiGii toxin family protein [Spirosoma sp.]OJW76803.1 MAG: hypothetical protein BGO59_21465 [Spirosoma sp. 48-14]